MDHVNPDEQTHKRGGSVGGAEDGWEVNPNLPKNVEGINKGIHSWYYNRWSF